MTEDQKTVNSTDYLQKFGYRVYDGKIEPRWKRVLNLMLFEITSTWRKSTFGKIMIIIIFVINFATLLSVATSSRTLHLANVGEDTFRNGLHGTVAGYLSMPNSIIISNPDGFIFTSDLGITIGLLLMIIFGIAGSGFFADDKSGKVIEIYLSKLQKKEYFMGKFGALFLYINMFILLPLMVICVYFVDVTGRDHLDYLDLYLGVLVYSLLCSLIFGSFILTLSIFVEKRSYASLIFVLVYLFGSIIGGIIAEENLNNKLFLLISPAYFLTLLAYVCLGDYEIGVIQGNPSNPLEFVIFPLNLNDGYSLEYWHVLLQAILLILIFSLILAYKLRKLTTEEL